MNIKSHATAAAMLALSSVISITGPSIAEEKKAANASQDAFDACTVLTGYWLGTFPADDKGVPEVMSPGGMVFVICPSRPDKSPSSASLDVKNRRLILGKDPRP